MKKSKILLLSTAAFILLLLISALAVLRMDVRTLVSDADKELKYIPVEVPAFSSLSVPAHWKVKVRQGRDFKIELAVKGNASFKPALVVVQETAVLNIDTTMAHSATDTVYARVTMPLVCMIHAAEEHRSGSKTLLPIPSDWSFKMASCSPVKTTALNT